MEVKILILEDDPEDAELLEHRLKNASIGCRIMHARDKTSYIEALSGFSPDVILSDHNLLSYSGFQAWNDMNQLGYDTPFILITGSLSDELASKIAHTGIDDFLLKDRLSRLPQAILNVLERWRTRRDKELYLEEIVRSEKKFRALTENISEGIVLIDKQGALVYQSPSVQRILGFSSEESTGKTLFNLIHPDDLFSAVTLFRKVQAEPGVMKQGVCRALNKSGQYAWLEGSITNMVQDEYIAGFIVNFRDITQRKTAEEVLASTLTELEQRVEERTRDLTLKNKDITDSIQYALHLQKALFRNTNLQRHFSDSFVFNSPQHIVGGDFYWFHPIDHRTFVACVDCTGHGVPGAFLSIIGVDLLNKIVGDKKWKKPAQVLKQMDQGIHNTIGRSEEGSVADGMDVALCAIDPVERIIHFAGAMSSVVVVSEKQCQTYKGSRFGLGGYMEASKKKFTAQDIPYKEGDMLYLFSDGYRDQVGGGRNKKFKHAQFEELLCTICDLPCEEQRTILVEHFNTWKGDNEQTDDVLVIGIRLQVKELSTDGPSYRLDFE